MEELRRQKERAIQGAVAGPAAGEEKGEDWRDLSRRRKREGRVDEAWKRLKADASTSKPEAAVAGGPELPSSEGEKRAFAADAIRTMREAAKFGFRTSSAFTGKNAKRVLVKETRNFAGKNVEVETEVDAASKQGKKAVDKAKATEKKRGLDYVLHLLDSKRKLNIIDKSKLDWKAYKRENKQVSIGRPQPSSSPGRPPIHPSLTLTPLRRPLQPKSKTKTKNSCFPFFSGGGGAQPVRQGRGQVHGAPGIPQEVGAAGVRDREGREAGVVHQEQGQALTRRRDLIFDSEDSLLLPSRPFAPDIV